LVDGLLKSFVEFWNGCDEKSALFPYIYYRELIFKYKYLRKYEGKTEKTLHGMRGPWAVSESIVNSKNPFRWTVSLIVAHEEL